MRFFLLALCLWQSYSALGAWETAISGVVIAPPAQGPDGRIYSCADDRALHCLDRETGKEYWAFRPGRRLTGFTVVSPDGRILIRTVKNVMVCVSPGGRELWRYALKGELKVPPASDVNGTVYLLLENGSIACLDRQGREVWSVQVGLNSNDIFAMEKGLLLLGTEEIVLLNPDGSIGNRSPSAIRTILYRFPKLYVQTETEEWGVLNPDSLMITDAESPLPDRIQYPNTGVLITAEGRIVSGREDWFMQAFEAGEEAYDPYYQMGGNPLRSRGVDRTPDPGGRRNEYREKGGNLLLSLISTDSSALNGYLAPYEKAKSLQELMTLDYNYDLALYDILAEANKVSADAMRMRTDNFSKSRIYRILTRWGDLRLREPLLLLAPMEKDPYNLSLILDGLGKIGVDHDGRSMSAIRTISGRYHKDPEVLNASVINAARLARYNGGRSLVEMMDFFSTLQNRSVLEDVTDQIHREMKAF